MSAFLAVNYGDRIELLTDGAIYEPDGTLTAVQRKVWTSNRLPIAITGRGASKSIELVAFAFLLGVGNETVDETLEGIGDRLLKMAARAAVQETTPAFEIVIAAISETRGPLLLYCGTGDIYGAGYVPFSLVDAGKTIGGGPNIDAAGIDASKGLRDCGVDIFERMRRIPGPNPAQPDLPAIYGIGGHVDHTVVAAAGVTVDRLHEWPDVIGQKIEPFAEAVRAAA